MRQHDVDAGTPVRAGTYTDARLLALATGNLIISTGVVIPVGMLPQLAGDLHVSAAAAGQLSTAYALTGCLLGPVLGAWSSRFDRRAVLITVLVVNALANVASALAPDYAWLLALRVVAAAFGVLHSSQAAVAASLLVPPERRGRAMAFVFLGVAMSSVVGLPLGAWLGNAFGWRWALGVLGLAGIAAAALTLAVVPGGLRVPSVHAGGWQALWRHRLLPQVLSVSALQYSGQAVLFSYLAVSWQWSVDADASTISLLLAVFGVFAIVGNLLAGRVLDRVHPAQVQAISLSGLATAFLLWKLAEGSMPLTVLATIVWGCFGFVTNTAQQVRLLGISPTLAPLSVAVNTSCIMLGHALGTAVGGIALAWGGPGVLPWLGLPFFALAGWASAGAQRRASRTAGSPQAG